MALDLQKEEIFISTGIGKEKTQLMVEGDIVVPDSKQDIRTVLRVGCQAQIDGIRVMDDRIAFKGNLKVMILYIAKKSEKPVHSMTGNIPFEDYINIEGVDKDTNVNLKAVVENIDYKVINDRKINVKSVVMADAFAEKQNEYRVIKEIEDAEDIQFKEGTLNVNNCVEDKKDRFVVKKDVYIPSGKPNIGEVLQTDVMITESDAKAMDGRVSVDGKLLVSTIYIGDTDESIIDVVENEIEFNGVIEAENAQEGMMCQLTLNVDDQYMQVVPDDDGEERKMEAEITIDAGLKVTDSQNIELVEDAYSIKAPLDINREKITYPQLIGHNVTKSTVKETVVIDGKYPELLQVCKVWGDVTLDSIEVKNDMLEAEGVINLEVLYIAEDDNNPVSVVPVSVPFLQEIEVKGAREDMAVEADVKIENISFSMMSKNEVEIRVTLGFDIFVMKEVNGEIITEIGYSNGENVEFKEYSSMIIYIVQNGDTLWNIAKKYNTTVADLMLVNDLENPDIIYPGEKILILKKVTE